MKQSNQRRSHGETTVIGSGSVVEGSLVLTHPIRVEGTLKGSLKTEGSLVVGEDGEVIGEVLEVGDATISGKVSGKLVVSGSVRLVAGGELHGTVVVPHLILEEGALLREVRTAEDEADEADDAGEPSS